MLGVSRWYADDLVRTASPYIWSVFSRMPHAVNAAVCAAQTADMCRRGYRNTSMITPIDRLRILTAPVLSNVMSFNPAMVQTHGS